MSTQSPDITDLEESKSGTNAAHILASRRGPFALLLTLTLFSGVVHGFLDGRWSNPPDLLIQGERLSDLPAQAGDWVMTDSVPLDEGAAKILRCYGSEVRTYRNEKTQALVTAAVLFGPRGPIAVHTPEICYRSVGTSQVGETQAQTIATETQRHQLWSAKFSQASQPEPSLDVWYGWSDGGPWEARDYPRFWMTKSLYKVQVAGPIGNESEEPCREFLKAFLPQLESVIQ